LTDDRQEIAPEVDGLLREWARWAKRRSWSSSTCASAEKKYSPPLGEVWDDEPKPLPADARLAWKVECVWRKVTFKERMTLKAAYITAPSYRDAEAWDIHKRRHCRIYGIRRSEFDRYVFRAANMVYNRLLFQGIADTIHSVVVPPLGQERVSDAPPSRAAFSLEIL
jgi:hypothetical protein